MESYICIVCHEPILINDGKSIPKNETCPECTTLWSAGFRTAYFGTQEQLNNRVKRKDKLKKFKLK